MAKEDGRPRREQIAADLRAEILAGLYADQMPSTIGLQERFGGSNNTIMSALGILEAEGLIYRRQGSGTFVKKRTPLVVTAMPYYDPKTSPYRYGPVEVRVLSVAEPRAGSEEDRKPPSAALALQTVPARVAKLLGLEWPGKAVCRTRVMILKDGEVPVELSTSYYDATVVEGTRLTVAGKVPGGSPRVLAELGLPQTSFEDLVSTRPPTHQEVEQLGLPDDAAVLQTLRVIRSGERPVEVVMMAKGGHLFELAYSGTVH